MVDVSAWIGLPLTESMVAAIVAPWAQAYVGSDGQVDKANGRTADTISIIVECERLQNEARPENRD
jgi:hypothetical protein